jgi:hypothetical protein
LRLEGLDPPIGILVPVPLDWRPFRFPLHVLAVVNQFSHIVCIIVNNCVHHSRDPGPGAATLSVEIHLLFQFSLQVAALFGEPTDLTMHYRRAQLFPR